MIVDKVDDRTWPPFWRIDPHKRCAKSFCENNVYAYEENESRS